MQYCKFTLLAGLICASVAGASGACTVTMPETVLPAAMTMEVSRNIAPAPGKPETFSQLQMDIGDLLFKSTDPWTHPRNTTWPFANGAVHGKGDDWALAHLPGQHGFVPPQGVYITAPGGGLSARDALHGTLYGSPEGPHADRPATVSSGILPPPAPATTGSAPLWFEGTTSVPLKYAVTASAPLRFDAPGGLAWLEELAQVDVFAVSARTLSNDRVEGTNAVPLPLTGLLLLTGLACSLPLVRQRSAMA